MLNQLDPSSPGGKLLCPHCEKHVGEYCWLGVQCQCGDIASPGFALRTKLPKLTSVKLKKAKEVGESTFSPESSMESLSQNTWTRKNMDEDALGEGIMAVTDQSSAQLGSQPINYRLYDIEPTDVSVNATAGNEEVEETFIKELNEIELILAQPINEGSDHTDEMVGLGGTVTEETPGRSQQTDDSNPEEPQLMLLARVALSAPQNDSSPAFSEDLIQNQIQIEGATHLASDPPVLAVSGSNRSQPRRGSKELSVPPPAYSPTRRHHPPSPLQREWIPSQTSTPRGSDTDAPYDFDSDRISNNDGRF